MTNKTVEKEPSAELVQRPIRGSLGRPVRTVEWSAPAFVLAALGVPMMAMLADGILSLLIWQAFSPFRTLFVMTAPAYLFLALPIWARAIPGTPSSRLSGLCLRTGMGINLVGTLPLYTLLALLAGADLARALFWGVGAMVMGFAYGWVNCRLFAFCYRRALPLARWLTRPWPAAAPAAGAAR